MIKTLGKLGKVGNFLDVKKHKKPRVYIFNFKLFNVLLEVWKDVDSISIQHYTGGRTGVIG